MQSFSYFKCKRQITDKKINVLVNDLEIENPPHPHDAIVACNKAIDEEKKARYGIFLKHINNMLEKENKKPITITDLVDVLTYYNTPNDVSEKYRWIIDELKRLLATPSSELFKRIVENKKFSWNESQPLQPFTAPNNQVNFSFTVDEYTGGTSIANDREKDEDRFLAGSHDASIAIDYSPVLSQTIAELSSLVNKYKIARNQGSCFIANVILQGKIYTANLGDSTTFLVTIDEEQKKRAAKLLNSLHNTDNQDECKKVLERGGYITYAGHHPRVNGHLAVTRALGDTEDRNWKGHPVISNEPETIITEIPKKGISFLITACDGMTENNVLTKEKIAQIVVENRNKTPEQIAKILALSAYTKSGDNIIVEVTKLSDIPDNKIVYTGVFDGHGGDVISELVYQNFDPVFLKLKAKYEFMQTLREELKKLDENDPHNKGIRNIAKLAKNPLATMDQIVQECKLHTGNFTAQMKHSIFASLVERTDAADALYHALANIEKIYAIFPDITNLKQLMIADQKCNRLMMIQEEMNRLSMNDGHYMYNNNGTALYKNSEAPQDKVKARNKRIAYKLNYDAIRNEKNPDIELEDICNKVSEQKVGGLNNITNVGQVLADKRGIANATSKNKLDKLTLAPKVENMLVDLGIHNGKEIVNIEKKTRSSSSI